MCNSLDVSLESPPPYTHVMLSKTCPSMYLFKVQNCLHSKTYVRLFLYKTHACYVICYRFKSPNPPCGPIRPPPAGAAHRRRHKDVVLTVLEDYSMDYWWTRKNIVHISIAGGCSESCKISFKVLEEIFLWNLSTCLKIRKTRLT